MQLCCAALQSLSPGCRAGAGALSPRNSIFLPPLEHNRALCKVLRGEGERISRPGHFPTQGAVTSGMTLRGFYQHPNRSVGGRLPRKRGNSRKREFGEAPCVSRRGERSWSVNGEGNDAAQRYGARKARLASEKCLPQARCPRCRGAAPDRKMPCSMRRYREREFSVTKSAHSTRRGFTHGLLLGKRCPSSTAGMTKARCCPAPCAQDAQDGVECLGCYRCCSSFHMESHPTESPARIFGIDGVFHSKAPPSSPTRARNALPTKL